MFSNSTCPCYISSLLYLYFFGGWPLVSEWVLENLWFLFLIFKYWVLSLSHYKWFGFDAVIVWHCYSCQPSHWNKRPRSFTAWTQFENLIARSSNQLSRSVTMWNHYISESRSKCQYLIWVVRDSKQSCVDFNDKMYHLYSKVIIKLMQRTITNETFKMRRRKYHFKFFRICFDTCNYDVLVHIYFKIMIIVIFKVLLLSWLGVGKVNQKSIWTG